MMISLAGVFTCHPCMAAMIDGPSLVRALRFRAVCTCMRPWRLLEVIGINFLLRLGQYRERWENSNCQHES
jgi:hypothetical protein